MYNTVTRVGGKRMDLIKIAAYIIIFIMVVSGVAAFMVMI